MPIRNPEFGTRNQMEPPHVGCYGPGIRRTKLEPDEQLSGASPRPTERGCPTCPPQLRERRRKDG